MTVVQNPLTSLADDAASAFEDQTTVAAKRIGATLSEVRTSHMPQQSQPAAVDKVSLEAVRTISAQKLDLIA